VRFWDAANGQPRASLIAGERLVSAVSATGHYRGGPGVERELVYVVLTGKGQVPLELKEFARKYRWKNAPASVQLTGK
jgi:hypothetical protein